MEFVLLALMFLLFVFLIMGVRVVKNNMVNVLKEMPNSFGWPTPGPSRPEHRGASSGPSLRRLLCRQ